MLNADFQALSIQPYAFCVVREFLQQRQCRYALIP
jgi:hypothetical protein